MSERSMNDPVSAACVAGELRLAALAVAASCLGAWCAAAPAGAALTFYQDEASWRAAAGATTTIGVPNVPQGEIYNPQLGLVGSGCIGWTVPSYLVAPWGVSPDTNIMWTGQSGVWTNAWTFNQPTVTAFAIDWLFLPASSGFLGADVYLGGTHVGSVSGAWQPATEVPGPTRFYGFTSSQPFNQVRVTAVGPSWGRAVMFSQIPAPGALAVLVLAPLATRGRRRA